MNAKVSPDYETAFIAKAAKSWKEIKNHRQYNQYMEIGAALAIGRRNVMHETGTNETTSGKYRTAFSDWCKLWGFGGMDKSLRSDLLFLQEPQYRAIADEIRSHMSEALKLRVSHPHAMVLRVRAHLKGLQDEPKRRAAEALAAAADRDEQLSAEPDTDPERIAAHYLSRGTANDVARLIITHRNEPKFIRTLIQHLQEQLD